MYQRRELPGSRVNAFRGGLYVALAVIASYVMFASSAWATGSTLVSQVSTPVATPTWWEPPLPPPYTPPPPDPVVIYEVKGTASGQHLKLRIMGDGSSDFVLGTITTTEQFGRYEPDVYHLIGLAQTADFFSLRSSYDKGGVKNDVYDVITVRQGELSKTVTVAEFGGRGITPPGLLDMIAALRQVAYTHWEDADQPKEHFPLPRFPQPGYKSSGATITYYLLAPGFYDILQIQPDGKAFLYEPSSRTLSDSFLPTKTAQLTPTLMMRLESQIISSDFYNFEYPAPVPPDPNTPTPLLPIVDGLSTVTVITQHGQSKSIEIGAVARYVIGVPQTLEELDDTLYDIFEYVEDQGTPIDRPTELIYYYAAAYDDSRWEMYINTSGGVYLNGQYMGQLTQPELDELINLFIHSDWFGFEDLYVLPGRERELGDQSVSVGLSWQGRSHGLIARSRADVPPGLNTVFVRLAELHGRFQAKVGIQVGMPKAGGTWATLRLYILLAIAFCLLGVALRLLTRSLPCLS